MKEFSLLKKFNWELLNSPIPAPVIPPYKVYSALITQNGGDDPNGISGESPLYIGVTYTISNVAPGDNLIPYGAPNNQPGTSFVCNKSVSSWGNVSSGVFYNTGAPVVNVLENTLGDVWFTYVTMGGYAINSNSLFIASKSATNSQIYYSNGNDNVYYMYLDYYDINTFILNSKRGTDGNDSVLNNIFLEIRVYN